MFEEADAFLRILEGLQDLSASLQNEGQKLRYNMNKLQGNIIILLVKTYILLTLIGGLLHYFAGKFCLQLTGIWFYKLFNRMRIR